MTPGSYAFARPDGTEAQEYALCSDHVRAQRLLIIPALFDEGHKLRRLIVDVMRRLDGAGIDSFLPDLPGTGESLCDLDGLSLADWHRAISAARLAFAPTHLFALRGGALLCPADLPGWHYGAVKGANLLRTLIRARTLAAREAGREEQPASLLQQALQQGIELGGYRLSAQLVTDLQGAEPPGFTGLHSIDQDLVGGSPLWLRAEPDADGDQADAIAAIIAVGMKP